MNQNADTDRPADAETKNGSNPALYEQAGEDVLETARLWLEQGRRVALATVVSTWGSSPRPVGSQCAIDDQGNFTGSVSGGCVEGAVITRARQVIEDGQPTMLEFGVSNDEAWEVGLACGGRIEVRVEAITD